jgi:hypothetical protein
MQPLRRLEGLRFLHDLEVSLELLQFRPVPDDPRLQQRLWISAREDFQHQLVAQLGRSRDRLVGPGGERLPALVGDRIDPPPSPSLLLFRREVPGRSEAGGLLVGGGVRNRPEVLDRALQRPFDHVGGRRAELLEQGEERIRSTGELDRL